MGQTVATRTENCPCPTCDTAPDGTLVENILDGGSYLSTGYTPVLVGGTMALKCGLGYTANGSSFSCVYHTPYAGVFATPYPVCLPEKTTTSTPAPKTTAGPSTTPYVGPATTTRIENVTTYTVKSALTLDFGKLPENVTAAQLANDTTFMKNVEGSIATGLGVDPSKVTVTKISVVTDRRLSEAEQRRLQGTKLKIEYELVTTSEAEAKQMKETLSDPAKAASFGAAFKTALVASEAASGRTVEVKDIVTEEATMTQVTTAVVVTPKPAPTPGDPSPSPSPGTAPSPSPGSGSPAPGPGTPAPTPAAEKEEEEESDNGAVIGGVVGGVVGLGVLGGAIYMFKKKSAQE